MARLTSFSSPSNSWRSSRPSSPRPAVNLLLYHAVLAPHARWRSQVVRYGRPAPDSTAHQLEASHRAAGTPSAWTWAALMRRVVDLAVLACPRRGGRLRVIATAQAPLAVQAILAHLARSNVPAPPGPALPAPAALTSPAPQRLSQRAP
jgi:hypothetical protein